MSESTIETETAAINAAVHLLESLPSEARQRALEFIAKRLGCLLPWQPYQPYQWWPTYRVSTGTDSEVIS